MKLPLTEEELDNISIGMGMVMPFNGIDMLIETIRQGMIITGFEPAAGMIQALLNIKSSILSGENDEVELVIPGNRTIN